jgi:HlyD family secretion protein
MPLDVAPGQAQPQTETVAAVKVNDNPRREIMIGVGIAAAFFLGFLGWAAMTPLDAGAYASGVVAVSGNRQAVQHRDGGTVTAVYVVEGATVTKGQMLVEIGAGEIRANERGLAGQVLTLLAQRARLVAERDRQASIVYPPEFVNLSAEDRIIALDVMNLQQLQFQARRDSILTQKGVLEQRILQLNEQIAGSDRQLIANREQQRLIGEETTGMKSLADQGYAPVNRVRALERNQAQLVGEEGALVAQIARSREAIGEARLQSISLDRQVVEEVAGQLRDVQVQLDELQPKLTAIRDQLARATVRAPAGGKVVGLTTFTVGGVVSPGQVLMEVVPGDKALVDRSLPILRGVLTKISADSFTDEKSGQQFFRAEISVPEEEMTKIRKVRGPRTGIGPGLPVEVVVPLRKRNALQYLTEPLFQTFWKTGREH